MITVTQLPDNRLCLKCHYYYKDRIRKIPTAFFSPQLKQWIVESYMLGTLENEFQGELVYKTPRWVILNQPMPDLSNMYEISDKSIKTPELKLKPYDYQDYGIRFMIDKLLQYNFCLNCDSVGTGKSIHAIGVMKWFIENKNFKKILIIGKKSIKSQWKSEISKFTDLNKDFYIDYTPQTPKKRQSVYDNYANADKGILITNYHNFLNDDNIIKSLKIDLVIIDEVHEIKARTGKLNNKIAKVVQNKPIVFLTGTPIMSKPEDLFGILQIANPKYLGSYKEFSDNYLVWARTNFGYEVIGAKNLDTLRQKTQDILIRRTEYEVSIQMPKTNIIKKDCEMDNTQIKILNAISEEQQDILNNMNALKDKNGAIKDKTRYDMLEGRSKGLIAARQAACNDPRMFLMSTSKMMKENYGKLIPSSYKMSSKIENILDIVQEIIDNDDKVIIFSKFRMCAMLIAQEITSVLKTNVLMYTGAENDETRDNNIFLFQNSNNHQILIGTDAMSAGLNLQCARFVINVDQPDTYAIKTQRIGRVRRASSAYDNVIIYDMITSSSPHAKSKDEERLENIENNKNTSDALISIDSAQQKALINAMKNL